MGKTGPVPGTGTHPPTIVWSDSCFPQHLIPEVGTQKVFGSSGGLTHLCLLSSWPALGERDSSTAAPWQRRRAAMAGSALPGPWGGLRELRRSSSPCQAGSAGQGRWARGCCACSCGGSGTHEGCVCRPFICWCLPWCQFGAPVPAPHLERDPCSLLQGLEQGWQQFEPFAALCGAG